MLSWSLFSRENKPTWGDGFFDESLGGVYSPVSLDFVTPDELFRYLPGLALIDRSAFWGVFKRICEEKSDACPSSLVGVPVNLSEEISRIVKRVLGTCDYRALLFRERDAALISFIFGVHPAYLWAEALISHDRFASFAWLGQAIRSRRAYIPLEVVSYLSDVILDMQGRIICTDTLFAEVLPPQLTMRALRQSIERRKISSHAIFTFQARKRSPTMLHLQK